MTHEPRPRLDPLALAASLQLWVAELVAWLVEGLGENTLTRSLRRWLHHELDAVERGAQTLVVMAALKRLPPPPPMNRTLRPLSAGRGFRRVFIVSNEMRGVTRRLSVFFDRLDVHAQRVARRIARFRPMTRIAMIAPPAAAFAAQCITCVMLDDSS